MAEKRIVELSDEEMDMISGGMQFWEGGCRNQDTGEIYTLLVDRFVAFGLVNSLGPGVSEAAKVDALRAAGYIA